MVAYVAVQKKLLTTIYALYKKGEWFDPNFNVKIVATTEQAVPLPLVDSLLTVVLPLAQGVATRR